MAVAKVASAGAKRAWELWRAIGSPRWVCAPMVDGSELAFRELVRRYGVQLCYTPMINSKIFVADEEYRKSNFTTLPRDRPLCAQFCADDPDTFVAAAKLLQDKVDAVDLNLGCPQNIAKRGHYGSFLQDEWGLVASIVRAAADGLRVPVWCKIRIFPCVQKSIEYAQMLESAGASLIAVHGRTREQKGKFCPPADLDVIRAIKRAVSIPVIANGNVLSFSDAERALEATGADAVMSAFALLDNPANFYEAPGDGLAPSRLALSREYLALAEAHGTPMRMVRLHMFKLLRSRLDVNMDVNGTIAGCRSVAEFYSALKILEARCDADGVSFEERVASGNTPRHVMAPKTIERMRKAEAAAGVAPAVARRRLIASAGSAAWVDSSHFLVAAGSVAHSALAGAAAGGDAAAAAAAAAAAEPAAASSAQGRKRKADAPPSVELGR
jgi:tRNA-dihydrouridine synthase 1